MKYLVINKEQLKRISNVLYNEEPKVKDIIQTSRLANGDTLFFCAEKLADSQAVKLYWCSSQNVSK